MLIIALRAPVSMTHSLSYLSCLVNNILSIHLAKIIRIESILASDDAKILTSEVHDPYARTTGA